MERDRRWYNRFGIEAPFPWLGIGLAVAIGIIVETGLAYVALQLFDCDIFDVP